MNGVLGITFYILLSCFLALKKKSSFARIMPVSLAILECLLLILAMINKMHWIDYFSFTISIAIIGYFLVTKPELKQLLPEIFMTAFVFCILIVICKNHVSYAADELRYWGLETKNLFFNDGFGKKGMDVAYLYGTYHPGLPLFMWWFCHFSPNEFSEGLMYAGYWSLCAIPIICALGCKTTWKNFIFLLLIILAVTIVLPSTLSEGYISIYAEYPMAPFLGLLINEVFHEKEDNIIFCSALVVVLSLLKSAGFLWAVLVLTMGLVRNKQYKKRFLIPLFCGLVISGVWRGYCYFLDRTSYYSEDILNTINEIKWNGKLPFLIDFIDYTKNYFTAFIKDALHASNDAIVNITPLAFTIIFLLAIFIASRNNLISKRDGEIISLSYIIAQIVFSIVIIFMCTFVFRESWIKEPGNRISFIARYGFIFYMGMVFFLIFRIAMYFDKYRLSSKIVLFLSFAIFIILCADFNAVYNGFRERKDISNYVKIINQDISSRYADALSSAEKEAVLVENIDDNSIYDRYFFIQYVGAPMKLMVEQSSSETLEDNIEYYKTKYGTENIFTYGF